MYNFFLTTVRLSKRTTMDILKKNTVNETIKSYFDFIYKLLGNETNILGKIGNPYLNVSSFINGLLNNNTLWDDVLFILIAVLGLQILAHLKFLVKRYLKRNTIAPPQDKETLNFSSIKNIELEGSVVPLEEFEEKQKNTET